LDGSVTVDANALIARLSARIGELIVQNEMLQIDLEIKTAQLNALNGGEFDKSGE
jgi:hypothetical protein